MKKRTKLYIAAVVIPTRPSHRNMGDWGSFISTDEKDAISQAVKARKVWTTKAGISETFYKIAVGELTHQAMVQYRTTKVPLEIN